MTTRNERIAEIEILFRAGNDRMFAWAESQERVAQGETLTFFCECGRRRCRQHIGLSGPEYEAVRSDSRRFLIARGHEFPEAEDVVEEHDGYVVVQKHEDVRDLVERMNLRSARDDESS
jgi:hypothetical protein